MNIHAVAALALFSCSVASPVRGSDSEFSNVGSSRLCVTSGRVSARDARTLSVESAGMRAVVARDSSRSAEIAFVYRGPSATTSPLASGELRRQIGLKLRAADTCNVVYVMWHVDPTPGVFVSVKHNP